ncbi:DUF692 domain-containing protein [Thermaurantiacus sp.]
MPADPAAGAPRLGIGLMVTPAFAPLLEPAGLVDYLAVTPDMFWQDHGAGASPRYTDIAAWVAILARASRPQVAHHIGLSIASAEPMDPAYVAQMAAWAKRWCCHWISEHLAFVAIHPEGGAGAAGLALTAPFDLELLDLVSARARAVRKATGRPFLLENSARFVQFADDDMEEAEFLNRFCDCTGAGLLLDLHNLYCNAANFGASAHAFLDRLELGHVVEIHVAGGAELAGMWSDAHSGAPPEPVWDLLQDLVPRAPNLRGITFEMHDSYLPVVGLDGVADILERARAVWKRGLAAAAA